MFKADRNETRKGRIELKHASLKHALREDVQVSHNIDKRVRMVTRSRRERMVAHDFTDAPFSAAHRDMP